MVREVSCFPRTNLFSSKFYTFSHVNIEIKYCFFIFQLAYNYAFPSPLPIAPLA